jgi:alpha-tubulin suppressor-like RCC1 family protein
MRNRTMSIRFKAELIAWKWGRCKGFLFAFSLLLAIFPILASRSYHSCVISSAGSAQPAQILCWGFGDAGALGNGDDSHRFTPTSTIPLNSEATSVSVGYGHSCAVSREGAVYCWGANWDGQLGVGDTCCGTCYASTVCKKTPIEVVGLSSSVAISLGLGGSHSCAVLSGGSLKCWGRNAEGQLGNDGTTNRLTPTDVFGLSSGGVSCVAGGMFHTCAILVTGALKCWGRNLEGQLGIAGVSTMETVPRDVVGMGSGVWSIALGEFHSCAIVEGGKVSCWGTNNFGQLGDGSTTTRTMPTSIAQLNGVTSLSVGQAHGCVVIADPDGIVKCWGRNTECQLGRNFDSTFLPSPVQVPGLLNAVAVALGQYASFVQVTEGIVHSFGYDWFGQLGVGRAAPDTCLNHGYCICSKTLQSIQNSGNFQKLWNFSTRVAAAAVSMTIATGDRVAAKSSVAVTLAFTTSAALAIGGQITLGYPSGFFAISATPTIANGATSVITMTATAAAPGSTQLIITTAVKGISSGTAFTITLSGMTMGAATAGSATGITVQTDADTVASAGAASGGIFEWPTAQLSVARWDLAAASVGNVAIFAGGNTGNRSFALFVEGLLFGLTSVGDAVVLRV